MSFSLHLASAQTSTLQHDLPMACTASKSSREEIGKPASITSTPRDSNCLANTTFSSFLIAKPGACSPSLREVSKILICLIGGSHALSISLLTSMNIITNNLKKDISGNCSGRGIKKKGRLGVTQTAFVVVMKSGRLFRKGELELVFAFAIDRLDDPLAVLFEAGSARDGMTHDDVRFEIEQVIGLSFAGSVG